LGAARERVRVARALETLPRLAEALARGQLSYAKVRALTRVATPKEEEKLLAIGRAGTAEHVERIVRGWRRMDRKEEVRETALQHAGRALHVYQNEDGMVTVRGRLTPEAGALLVRAPDAAREALYQKAKQTDDREPQSDPPTMAQQQADALVLLAETALHHEIDPGAPGERYQVVVHVDAAVLADAEAPGQSVFEEGARVSAETSRRFACDRGQDTHDPASVKASLALSRPHLPLAPPHCHLVLLCRCHHRAVHEEGYQVDRERDGELRFRRPDGRVIPEVPPPSPVPDDPAEATRAKNAAEGVRVDARTATPGWCGERLDLGWAMDVLHPLAR
jgi:Domain of unknown function (DUF222)